MAIKIGRAKHNSKMTLDDWLRHPIWVSAHDGRHDEEWFKPVDSTEGVIAEVLQIDAPILALQIIGADVFATGYYDGIEDRLFGVAIHVNGQWMQPNDPHGLKFPIELKAIPSIRGKTAVRFVLPGPEDYFAERKT